MDQTKSNRNPISAFVISYNREDTITACLKSLSFADEIILIDKSSTDRTAIKARGLCDKIVFVPWTPTVEETRSYAYSLCQHDWVVFLDDDEVLNRAAVKFIINPINTSKPAMYSFPRKDYIIGIHSEETCFWPNWQLKLLHKSLMNFTSKVHHGYNFSGEITKVGLDTGARIEHFSHADVSVFVEKTNRYTSQRDRHHFGDLSGGLSEIAHNAIEQWQSRSGHPSKRSYSEAVGLLMAVYEIVDALKIWEEEQKIDGRAEFAFACARIESQFHSITRKTRILYHPKRSDYKILLDRVLIFAKYAINSLQSAIRK